MAFWNGPPGAPRYPVSVKVFEVMSDHTKREIITLTLGQCSCSSIVNSLPVPMNNHTVDRAFEVTRMRILVVTIHRVKVLGFQVSPEYADHDDGLSAPRE